MAKQLFRSALMVVEVLEEWLTISKKNVKNSTVKDGLALSGFYDFDELQKWLENNL